MLKWITALAGLAAVAAPAQASTTEHADYAAARHTGTIEAFEDFLGKHPRTSLLAELRLELARFECSSGIAWKCGTDTAPKPDPNRYGG